jgi:excisionase family DNA binding protein
MIVLTFDSEQLNKIIQNAVRSVLAETPTAPAVPADSKPLLSRKEAAELAGVCITTIDNRVKEGVLKKCRVGGVVRFKREQVLEVFSQTVFKINPRKNNRAAK